MSIEFVCLDHEVKVRGFANFIINRGMKLVAITHAVSSTFAVWFEASDTETATAHIREWFDAGDSRG